MVLLIDWGEALNEVLIQRAPRLGQRELRSSTLVRGVTTRARQRPSQRAGRTDVGQVDHDVLLADQGVLLAQEPQDALRTERSAAR